jgi:hypothetical protein
LDIYTSTKMIAQIFFFFFFLLVRKLYYQFMIRTRSIFFFLDDFPSPSKYYDNLT